MVYNIGYIELYLFIRTNFDFIQSVYDYENT